MAARVTDARVSSALVVEGSALSGLAVGDTLFVRVFRDTDHAEDDHPGDAQLHLLRLRYTANG
jgi:hypothetical protein